MAEGNIEIVGMDKAIQGINALDKELTGSIITNAMRQSTLIATNTAKRLAPVDTGRLRASITPSVVSTANEVKGVVGSNVTYAPYMEFGTAPHWPPPGALAVWARRHGMEEFVVRRSIGKRGTSMKALRTIGTKGWRYLERAWTQNAQHIINILDTAIARIVNQ